MSNDDKVQFATHIPTELKDLIDADSRTNYEVAESAFWKEFGGRRRTGHEQRLLELDKRETIVREEIKERENELQEIIDEKERIRASKEARDTMEERVLGEAARMFNQRMLDPDNPAIKKKAREAELPPEEFVDRLRDRMSDE